MTLWPTLRCDRTAMGTVMCLFTQWAVGRPAVLFSQYCVGSQQRGTRTIVNTGAVPSVRIRPTDGRTPMSRAHTRLSCVTTLSTGSAARLGTHTHTARLAVGTRPWAHTTALWAHTRPKALRISTQHSCPQEIPCTVCTFLERASHAHAAGLSLTLSLTY